MIRLARECVDCDVVHAETHGPFSDGPAGTTETNDAHGHTIEFDFFASHVDPMCPRIGAEFDRGMDLTSQGKQQTPARVSQMPAYQTLLASQHDIGVDEVVEHEHVDTRRSRMHPAQVRSLRIETFVHDAEDDLGVGGVCCGLGQARRNRDLATRRCRIADVADEWRGIHQRQRLDDQDVGRTG